MKKNFIMLFFVVFAMTAFAQNDISVIAKAVEKYGIRTEANRTLHVNSKGEKVWCVVELRDTFIVYVNVEGKSFTYDNSEGLVTQTLDQTKVPVPSKKSLRGLKFGSHFERKVFKWIVKKQDLCYNYNMCGESNSLYGANFSENQVQLGKVSPNGTWTERFVFKMDGELTLRLQKAELHEHEYSSGKSIGSEKTILTKKTLRKYMKMFP